MVPPKNSLFWKVFNASTTAHTIAFRASGGRIGGSMVGGPILLLHHEGAKSGKKRVSPLLYLPDDDRMVIVASKGGYTKHPGWYHNLKAHPDTAVELPKEGKVAVTARVAAPQERELLWPKVVDLYSGYADYQKSTERQIPLIILERR